MQARYGNKRDPPSPVTLAGLLFGAPCPLRWLPADARRMPCADSPAGAGELFLLPGVGAWVKSRSGASGGCDGLTPGGHAQQLLEWRWAGLQLEAQIARCTYFCRAHGREVLAWCELRDISGGRRCDIGSFPSVALARAACEADAERRVRAGERVAGPVDVRIALGRRRSTRGRAESGDRVGRSR